MVDNKLYVTVQCDMVAEKAAWILCWLLRDVSQSGDKTLKYFRELHLQKKKKKPRASLDTIQLQRLP